MSTDVPILTTSISMSKIRGKCTNPKDSNDMTKAWRQKFEITRQIPKNDKIKILRWRICFSECQDAPLKTHNFYVFCSSLVSITNEEQFSRSQDSMEALYQNDSELSEFPIKFSILQYFPENLAVRECLHCELCLTSKRSLL